MKNILGINFSEIKMTRKSDMFAEWFHNKGKKFSEITLEDFAKELNEFDKLY